MTKNKINSFQLSLLVFFLCTTSFLEIGFSKLFNLGKPDILLIMILGILIGYFLLKMFLAINNFEPNKNIFEKNTIVFGKVLGKLINALIIVTLLIVSLSLIFNFIRFIRSQYLVETPTIFIGLAFLGVCFYAASKDGEIITRIGIFLLLGNFLLFLASFIGLIQYINPSNLKPIFTAKPLEWLEYGYYFISLFALLPFLLSVFPKNQVIDPDNYEKYIKRAYWGASIIIMIISFTIITVLGAELLTLVEYPEYIVLQKIGILNFIERIENVTSIQWIFSIFMTITTIVYGLRLGLKETFQLKKKVVSNIGLGICCLLVLIFTSYLIPKSVFWQNTLLHLLPYILTVSCFIPALLIFCGIQFKKKKHT